MWLFNQTSSAAKTSLIYITVGALIMTWTAIWHVYLFNNPPVSHGVYYWANGFLVTGVVLFAIGFGVGRIGNAAKQAEHPAAVVGSGEVAPPVTVPVPAETPPAVAALPAPGPVPQRSVAVPTAPSTNAVVAR